MTPVSNPKIIYKAIPQGYPIPGEHLVFDASETLDIKNIQLNGGFITKTIVISPEPWLRKRLRDPATPPSYTTPMRLGYPMTGFGVVKVIRSEDPQYTSGDYYMGLVVWQLYTVHPWDRGTPAQLGQYPDYTSDTHHDPLLGLRKIAKIPNIPWSTNVAALGIPGQCAFIGLREYAPDMKPGQVIYISAAAGATGLMVVQFAKISGLKVIASTSSDEKVDYLLREVGADVAFNYKTTSIDSVLGREGPIDYYWDNVGGKTLEIAIEHCKVSGKIIVCGYISEYNHEEPYGIKSMHWVFKKRLQIHGLFAPQHAMKWVNKFIEEIPAMVSQGKLKSKEDIVHGLENAPQAFSDLLQGKNLGKTVVVVSEDYE